MPDFFGPAPDPDTAGAVLVVLLGFIPGLIRGILDLFGGSDA